MINKFIYLIVLMFMVQTMTAQAPKKPTSSDIHESIKKLNVLGTALYFAAHPDDENTRMIAYLANDRKLRTAYLSLTRGDGGQNLIGPEIRELLGVIRTQELLAARRVDGGQQFFSRANDFGYSKKPEETFNIWDKEKVLADAVWTIRKFKPDVIINRFSHKPRRTHGHHTASAMISYEAFDMAGDPTKFPEQLKYVDVWQPKRLLFNTSWWFYGSREKFAKAAKDNMVSVDVGVYYPTKGKSNTEIAAESRSMHKCQGFGSAGTRGATIEYLEYLKGSKPEKDLLENLDLSWSRVEGGAAIGELIAQIDKDFNYYNPSASIPALVKAHKMVSEIKDEHWKTIKLQEIEELIVACAGIFTEATTKDYTATNGESIDIKIEAINRSDAEVVLDKLVFNPNEVEQTPAQELKNNKGFIYTQTVDIPKEMAYSTPYWLSEKASLGMYTVKKQQMIGKPETPRNITVQFHLTVNGISIVRNIPVVFKKTDPVKGENYRPFEVLPPVFANINDKVYVFADDQPKTVNVVVKSGKANIKGQLKLKHPGTWRVEPSVVDFEIGLKGAEQIIPFKVYPSKDQSVAQLRAEVMVDGQTYKNELVLIEYDHIPTQTILRPATTKVVRLDIKKRGEKIGYVMGAGDDIPASLEQIGYKVDLLEDGDMTAANLKQYDAVILGIRAYNTNERMKFHQENLFNYAKDGGNLIVQYNTGHRLKVDSVAPYSLKISRDRVAVEEAEVRILKPDHLVMTFPNQITEKDFDGWVQERGLYFPNKWDKDKFEAILSSNDPNEPPRDGGLLVAKHGKGYFIYTGYSWFRELPAGVPGAYRIFTNLISIGQP